MKKKLLLFFVILFNFSYSFGQVTFQKTYGGSGEEYGSSIQLTSDGGYIATGQTSSFGAGSYDVYLVKSDSLGNVQWSKTYGGAGNDEANSVIQTADGSYVVVGESKSFGANDYDLYIIKTDSAGNLIWSKTYGRSGLDDRGYSLLQINGGFLVVGGIMDYGLDVFVLKINNNGDSIRTTNINSYVWYQPNHSGYWDSGIQIKATLDSKYIITGSTYHNDAAYNEAMNVKLDTNLNVIWFKTYRFYTNTESWSIDLTADSGFVFCGGYPQIYLAKINSVGNIQWSKSYGDGSIFGCAAYVERTLDGGYIMAAQWASSKILLIKTDSGGDTIWTKAFNGHPIMPFVVHQTRDKGFVVAATTSSGGNDILIIKTDSLGNSGACALSNTLITGTAFCSPVLRSPNTYVSCTAITPATVVNNGSPIVYSACGCGVSVSISTQNISCNGGNNGSIRVTPGGGTSPYTYLWSPSGQTGQTATNLTVGTYTVIVNDANGCSNTLTATVTQPTALTAITSVISNIGCSSSGIASVSAGGGTPSYTYLWSPSGGIGVTASNLTAGTYTVTVTDSHACSLTALTTITQSSNSVSVTTSASVISGVTCYNGNNGSAAVIVTTGTPPFTYQWLPSGGSSQTASNLTAGTYTVTVTDVNGCSSTSPITVTQPGQLILSMSSTNASCSSCNNASASASVTGGTGPYTYLWSPSGGSSATASNLLPGNYSCCITDAHGCSVCAGVTVNFNNNCTSLVLQPDSATGKDALLDSHNPSLNEGNNQELNPLAWTISSVPFITRGLFQFDLSSIPAGATIQSATLTLYNNPTSLNGLLNGQHSHLSGSNMSYLQRVTSSWNENTVTWNTQPTATSANQVVLPQDTNAHQNYIADVSMLVTDMVNNPSSSFGFMLKLATEQYYRCLLFASSDHPNAALHPKLEICYTVSLAASCSTIANVSCFGGTNGVASVTVFNGTAPYTFQWSPSGGNGSTASNLTAGTYTITVTDANASIVTATATVTQPGQLTLSMSSIFASCSSCNNGSASVSVIGGTAPYSYLWSPSGGSSATASNLLPGNYSCCITDAHGCSVCAGVTINFSNCTSLVLQPDSSTGKDALLDSHNPSLNEGSNQELNPLAWTISGSPFITRGLFQFDLSSIPAGATIQSATLTLYNNPTSLNGLLNGQHSHLSGSNMSYLQRVSSSWNENTVTWNTQPTATAANQVVLAQDTNAHQNYIADVTMLVTDMVNNPSSSFGFMLKLATEQYYRCLLFASSDHPNAALHPKLEICYTVSLAASCSTIANVSCFGGTNGVASVTVSNGTAPYTFQWSPSGGNGSTASNLTAGTYTITVTDANTSIVTATITITQPAALTTSGQTLTNVSCFNGNNGSVRVTAGGGTSPYTYMWSPSSQSGQTATNLTAGSYTVTVADANGCSNTSTATVTQPNALTATGQTLTNVSCFNGNNGSARVTLGGGTSPYTYLWSPSSQSGQTATNLTAGTYTVTVTDANGCSITSTSTVTQPTSLTATGQTLTNVSCFNGNNGSTRVTPGGGTSPYTYLWSPSSQSGQTATNFTAGIYTVTVTDANGCINTSTATITQPTALTTSGQTLTNVSCFNGNNGSVRVTPGGGTSPYTYLWSPSSQSGQTATNLTAGTYTVTVTDANGCSNSSTATVTQPTVLTASGQTVTNVSCFNGNNGSARVTPGGGTSPYTYLWSPSSQSGQTATNLTAGTYTVTVTDANGCSITSTATVTQPTALTASGQTVTNVSCFNGNNGSTRVTPGGGTSPYTYLWSPSAQTGQTATNLIAGSYTATVTDANGCSITSTSTVTQPTSLTATGQTLTNVSCFNGNNGSTRVTPGGGTSPYTYLWSPSSQSGQTATNLTAGTYTVTITDSHGCTITSTATVTQPGQLTISMSSANATCSSCNNGSASASVTGGTSPFSYLWSPSGGSSATASNLLPGNYTCCVTDAHGCSVCAGVTVNFNNCTAPTIQATNITFSNVTANSMMVNWTNGNGSRRIVKINTSNTFTSPVNGTDYTANAVYTGSEQVVYNGTGNSVTVTGLSSNGTYWLRVYEANCSGSNSLYLTSTASNNPNKRKTSAHRMDPGNPQTDNALSEEINSFRIIPNPAHSTFSISFKNEIQNAQLRIFDVTGRVVQEQKIHSQLSTFNCQLAAGVYFVKIDDGERVSEQKLVVE
jgi:hypothetical protein